MSSDRALVLLRLTAGVIVVLLGVGSRLAVVATAAEEPTEPTQFAYTLLGRGYAVVAGYPADEVPSTGGDEEDDGDVEPPPAQTCPADQQGVPEEIEERLADITGAEHEPVTMSQNEVPTPRGQPIKFDFGLADASLRSDPGSHAIAAFFYVDLGGAQDPWTSSEADGYASGHPREQERCGRPYFGQPGEASDVHVLSRATDAPAAFAFAQGQNQVLPGGMSMRESITVADMDTTSSQARAHVTTIVTGLAVGDLMADEVVTHLSYVTDGTGDGTHIEATTQVTNLSVAGTPVEVTPGAPPVDVGTLLVGIAAPEVRETSRGILEMTAGGLYVAGEADNPVGLQSKQAFFIGGAWLDASVSDRPSFSSSDPLPPPPEPSAAPSEAATETATATATQAAAPGVDEPTAPQHPPAFPSSGVAGEPAVAGAKQTAPPPAVSEPAETASPAPTLESASARLGVYRGPRQAAGPLLILAALLGGVWFGAFVWARHRYPEIRAALGTPLLAWLDGAYRSFMRG